MSPKRYAAFVAALLLAIALAACAKSEPGAPAPQPAPTDTAQKPPAQTTQPDKPVTNPPPATTETLPGEVDVVVRKALQGYLDAMNRKAYDEAAGYWSKLTSVSVEVGKTPGVSNWYFISSEMIDNTADIARVQLNFTVDVTPGTVTPYTNGRNVLFVTLHREQEGWKIMSMSTSP